MSPSRRCSDNQCHWPHSQLFTAASTMSTHCSIIACTNSTSPSLVSTTLLLTDVMSAHSGYTRLEPSAPYRLRLTHSAGKSYPCSAKCGGGSALAQPTNKPAPDQLVKPQKHTQTTQTCRQKSCKLSDRTSYGQPSRSFAETQLGQRLEPRRTRALETRHVAKLS